MEQENKTGISNDTLKAIKEDLLTRRDKILEDLKELSRTDSHEADNRGPKFPDYGDKPDENAQEISEYSTTLATEKLLEKTLADIEKTLKRIEDGSYGICKYCGQAINEKRLIARPIASTCIECKTKLQNS